LTFEFFILNLTDTHAHIYLEEFAHQRDAMMERAGAAGISKIYMPAIDSASFDDLLHTEKQFPNTCFAMVGLHPCYVKENYQEELDKVQAWLKQRSFAAIGECGLDFYWDKTYVKEQNIALEQQIAWAIEYKRPIVLHTRNATRETIEVVAKYRNTGLRGIFHCFGGTLQEANDIIELGFLLGIGGVLTYKNAGLDQVIREIDLKHIVLETDAPYLTPVPHRGKRNEPAYLNLVAEKLAEIKEIDLEEVARVTSGNAENVFKN
jgi:TatD DNase family protein